MSDEHERPADPHEASAALDVDVDVSDDDEGGADDLEIDVVEVEVVTVEVLEVDAETAFATRDALGALGPTDEAIASTAPDGDQDEALDEALEDLDAGDREVRDSTPDQPHAEHVPSGPGELPLLIAARERFSSLQEVVVTGDARVDAATARLDELPDLPTAEHVAVYDDVHNRLQDALADADPR